MRDQYVTLSVVIIGLNEADNLPRCFESVDRAAERAKGVLKGWSIIYVDSGSSDESVEVAKRYTKKVYRIISSPSAAAARMVGLYEATGSLVLFLDGDMELDSDWLRRALIVLAENENSHYAGVIGIRDDLYVDEASGDVVGQRHNVYGVKAMRTAPHFGGALLAKKDAILSAGGYRLDLNGGEEPDLYGRLLSQGMRILELPIPFVRHYTPERARTIERLVFLCKVSNYAYFGKTFWSAVREKYLASIAIVYEYTFWVWLMDLLTIIVTLIWGCLGFLIGQVLLVVGLVLSKKEQELLLARLRFAAVLAAIPTERGLVHRRTQVQKLKYIAIL